MNVKAILRAFAVACVVLACVFFPFSTMLLVIAPAPFVYLAVKDGLWSAAFGLILVLAGLYMVLGKAAAVLFLILFLLPILVLYYIGKKKKAGFEMLVLTCMSMFAGLALVALTIYLVTGKEIVSAIFERIRFSFEASQPGSPTYETMRLFGSVRSPEDLLSADLTALLSEGVVDKAVYVPQAIANLELIFRDALPMLAIGFTVYGGLFNYQLSRFMIRKAKLEVASQPPFARWMLPKSAGFGLLSILAVAGIGSLGGFKLFTQALDIVLMLVTAIFAIQGAAVVTYFLRYNPRNRMIAILAGVVLLMSGNIVVISTVLLATGIMEQILQIRKKIETNRNK